MSRSKYTNVVCIIICVAVLLLSCVYIFYDRLGITGASRTMEYESRLFDKSVVHTIDIQADEDEWQDMLDNANQEQYITCDLEIDGESYENVAIRPKGNNSLQTVTQMDSERVSFKVEFDHYDDSLTYYGLDKLALNNEVNDSTYMKDYLVYDMMRVAGADSPLASYVYITVNGEDWGLYTAIEGIEDGFAQRNYGSNYGKIYKPDSMSMNKDMEDGDFDGGEMPDMSGENGAGGDAAGAGGNPGAGGFGGGNEAGGGHGGGPDNMSSEDTSLKYIDDDPDSYSNIFDNAVFDVTKADKKRLIKSIKKLNEGEDIEEVVDTEEVISYFTAHNFVLSGDSYTGSIVHNYYLRENDGQMSMIPWDYNDAFGTFMGGGGGGHGSKSSDDAAGTDRDNAGAAAGGENTSGGGFDSNRFSGMPGGDDSGSAGDFDMDAIKEKMANMSEEELAELMENMPSPGGMGGGSDTTSLVNYPIDDPLLSGNMEDRPMLAWIFNDEEYTQQYHDSFDKFILEYFESGYFEEFIDKTVELISPYVEKDPTAFCSYEDFQKGAATLKTFCSLRAQSIRGQLNGTIPSTEAGQAADSSSLIDASDINVSDTGSQSMGGGHGGRNGDDSFDQSAGMSDGAGASGATGVNEGASDVNAANGSADINGNDGNVGNSGSQILNPGNGTKLSWIDSEADSNYGQSIKTVNADLTVKMIGGAGAEVQRMALAAAADTDNGQGGGQPGGPGQGGAPGGFGSGTDGTAAPTPPDGNGGAGGTPPGNAGGSAPGQPDIASGDNPADKDAANPGDASGSTPPAKPDGTSGQGNEAGQAPNSADTDGNSGGFDGNESAGNDSRQSESADGSDANDNFFSQIPMETSVTQGAMTTNGGISEVTPDRDNITSDSAAGFRMGGPGGMHSSESRQTSTTLSWVLILISFLVLIAGIIIAYKFKRY